MEETSPVLVLGGTGHYGRFIVASLLGKEKNYTRFDQLIFRRPA